MTKILVGDPVGTLELMHLEELFLEEVKCEFHHSKTTCGGEVTHRIRFCGGSINVCSTAAEFKRANLGKKVCDHCGKNTEYWVINPI